MNYLLVFVAGFVSDWVWAGVRYILEDDEGYTSPSVAQKLVRALQKTIDEVNKNAAGPRK